MKQKLFSLLALFLFVSMGLTTDTKAGSIGDELNSSVSENLKALTAGNPNQQCWMDVTKPNTPCAKEGRYGCAPCDNLLPPGPFPPTPPPPPTPAK